MASVIPFVPIYRRSKSLKKSSPVMQQQHNRPQGHNSSSEASTNSNGSSVTINRRTSLSSFPSSRSASEMSNRPPSRSPHPPPQVDTDRTSSSTSKTPSSAISSSQHSSLSAPPRYNPAAHPRRRLRSQYPRNDTENHVEYILVASFDVDKGPIMEHQYPVAITGDEHMLAELMLPDQAHVRNQDWTIFFLHKDTSQDDEEAEEREERRRQRQQRKDDRAARKVNGNGSTKNSIDEDYEDSDSDSGNEEGEGPPLIYVLNLVNTKQDKTQKRGAMVKTMAICTRHPFLHIYKVWTVRLCCT